jgi:hypothetical protein
LGDFIGGLFVRLKNILSVLYASFCLPKKEIFSYPRCLFSNIPSGIMRDLKPEPCDITIAERLLIAYQLSEKDAGQRPNEYKDVWSHIQIHQPTFFSALEKRDPVFLAHYLCNMSRHDATHGIGQGYTEYLKIKLNPLYRRNVSLYTKDKLVSLAEAVGAIPCENPEQGAWGKNIALPIDELVNAVEQVIGMNITPPAIDGGLLKIIGTFSKFSERDLNAIYTAWSLSNILREYPDKAICEIGAGIGRAAYWSCRFGVNLYAIIDLPHINVIQGYYLLKSCPPDTSIRLYGESAGEEQQNRKIVILPPHCIEKFPSKQFDLVLNQDSFPEIHADIVRKYLIHIKRISRRFLSINHESCPQGTEVFTQIRVQNIIEEVGGYDRLWRMPYWLRRGYVIELYGV